MLTSEQIQKYSKKTLPQLEKTATKVFNQYIRLRDVDCNGVGVCISSGVTLHYGYANTQAGHYISAGSCPELRFNEFNVNLQGKSDNYFKSGNLLEYRKNLIKKIGKEEVEKLELQAEMFKKTPYHKDRFLFIETIEIYKQKVKEISKNKMFKV